MSDTEKPSALARKIAVHNGTGMRRADLVPTLETGLTRALRRAGAPLEGLGLNVDKIDIGLGSTLDAGLDALPDHGLISAIEDQDGRRGLLALDQPLVDALIEVQTTGRVEEVQGPARPVTRIDEALCRDFIDLLFAAFAHETNAIVARDWPDRISYGSAVKDRGQLNLLLPAKGYHLFQAEVTAAGHKTGGLTLLMPTDPALARRNAPKMKQAAPRPETWADDLLMALGSAPLSLDAILLRVQLPLREVENFTDGDLIPFDPADLGAVSLETESGHVLARGKLGQVGGRRAIRLGDGKQAEPAAAPKAARPPKPIPTAPPPTAVPAPIETPPAVVQAEPALPDLPMDAAPLPEMPMAGFDPDAPIA